MTMRSSALSTAAGLLIALSSASADAPRSSLVTAMRSWSAPTNTRLVFDFSGVVAPVTPDSGFARDLVVSIPGDPLQRGPGVPEVLGVRDGVVDSVEIVSGSAGGNFHLWFRDSTRFRVFVLRADDQKPFRIVVDALHRAAAAPIAATPATAAPAASPRSEGTGEPRRGDRVRIVAVDPGHGGEDTGAKGQRGVLEKNVTLAIGRALVEELNRIPGIQGQLTRDGDYFVPLRDRYRRAEKMKADLFVSIHANSSPQRIGHGRGSEVYFLSLHGASDQAAKDLSDAENAADLVGGIRSEAEPDLVNILYDVKRSSTLSQSQLLAETLLDNLSGDRRVDARGVKQAGFAVLKSVEFPSVLFETAFINNPAEAKLLVNSDFQQRMAKELAGGVKLYFQRANVGLLPAGVGADADTRR